MFDTDLHLTCQHNVPLHTVVEYGVTTYHHPDDSACAVFNSLGMSFDTAMTTNFQHLLHTETPTIRVKALHLVSRAARQPFYEYLSACDAPRLHAALKAYLLVLASSPHRKALMGELFTIFGSRMRFNFSSLTNFYTEIGESVTECSRMGCALFKNGREEFMSELDTDLTLQKTKEDAKKRRTP